MATLDADDLNAISGIVYDQIENALTANEIVNIPYLLTNLISVNVASLDEPAIASINGSAIARTVVPASALPFQVVRRYDNEIILRRFSSFIYTLNDVGALTGVTKLIFTIKEKKESEADSASVLQIVLTIPAASGTDGVAYVNKGSGSAVRTDGSIAIQEYTENDVAKKRIVIAASDKVTALISKYDNCTFDVKQVISGDSDIIEEGDVKILDVNTRTISS